jgi:hypothetical protein
VTINVFFFFAFFNFVCLNKYQVKIKPNSRLDWRRPLTSDNNDITA